MVKLIKKPTFRKTITHLNKLKKVNIEKVLNDFGKRGVSALSSSTPIDTGETASSWTYLVEKTGNMSYKLSWTNSVMAGSVPLVIILNYGHGVDGGGYVPGKHFINPALEPVFTELRERLISEVLKT